jgi:NADH:ubiquinone oxidoreductase subunit K
MVVEPPVILMTQFLFIMAMCLVLRHAQTNIFKILLSIEIAVVIWISIICYYACVINLVRGHYNIEQLSFIFIFMTLTVCESAILLTLLITYYRIMGKTTIIVF